MKKTKIFSIFPSIFNKFSTIPKPFKPEDYGLSPSFRLTNFSDMKGWGCKLPQSKLLQYLSKIGKGDIGNETPDCSDVPISGTNKRLLSTIDFFYPVKKKNYIFNKIK